jgi:hypothetical protein
MNLPNYFLADLAAGSDVVAFAHPRGWRDAQAQSRDLSVTAHDGADHPCAGGSGGGLVASGEPVSSAGVGAWARRNWGSVRRRWRGDWMSSLGNSRLRIFRLCCSRNLATRAGWMISWPVTSSGTGTAPRTSRGRSCLVHIAAGNIPNPTLLSMVLGMLTRSAQFVKCASGTVLLPRLFAHSLYERDPKLATCLEVAEWRGGHTALEKHCLRRRIA